MDTAITPTYTSQFIVDVESPAILKTIKQLLKQLKGVNSVKEVKPKVKMSEAEFYDMIEKSAKTVRSDGANMKRPNESMSDYVNQLIATA